MKHNMHIFAAKVSSTNVTSSRCKMIPGKINTDLKNIIQAKSSSIKTGKLIRDGLSAKIRKIQDKGDYFASRATMPHVTTSISASLQNFNWKSTPFGEDDQSFENELSVVHLLQANESDKQYNKLRADCHEVEVEDHINGKNKDSKKVSSKAFTGGDQSSINAIILGITNTINLNSYTMETSKGKRIKHTPLLLVLLKKAIVLLNSHRVFNWESHFINEAPWIPHTILSSIHLIIAEFARQATDPTNLKKLRNGKKLRASIFKDAIDAYDRFESLVMGAVNTRTLGTFMGVPYTYSGISGNYQKIGKSKTTQRKEDGKDHNKEKPTRDSTKFGWLKNSNKSKKVAWPESCTTICKPFVTIGEECREGRNCAKDHGFYCKYTDDRKADISKVITDNDSLTLNTDPRTGGTESKPRITRRFTRS